MKNKGGKRRINVCIPGDFMLRESNLHPYNGGKTCIFAKMLHRFTGLKKISLTACTYCL